MFQLDDKFLEEVGLLGLPDDQKQAFLQHIYSELELRVGTKLSEGMTEEQLGQFEAFVDTTDPRKTPEEQEAAFNKVIQWFERYQPNYEQAADFQSLKASAPATVPPAAIIAEYGSLKWLELNRPDYKQVVASELEKLKTEIASNKDTLLGTDAQAA